MISDPGKICGMSEQTYPVKGQITAIVSFATTYGLCHIVFFSSFSSLSLSFFFFQPLKSVKKKILAQELKQVTG